MIPRVSDTIEIRKSPAKVIGLTRNTQARGVVQVSPVTTEAPPERDGRDARWDSHRKKRRAELVDATLRAVRKHGGSPSMDQIAEIAKTSKPALYRYFSDQAGLYGAVAERIDSAFIARLNESIADIKDPHTRLHRLISEYLIMLEADPEIYRFLEYQTLLEGRAVEYPSKQTVSQITALFSDVLQVRQNLPTTPLLMAGVISLMRTTADQWITSGEQGERATREVLARDLTALLWSGAAGPGR